MPLASAIWEGGSDRFFYKGTNGRWREVMTAEDIALYEQVAARMTPGLASWIERGRSGAGDPRTAPE
jgi:aryl sulfotransferase